MWTESRMPSNVLFESSSTEESQRMWDVENCGGIQNLTTLFQCILRVSFNRCLIFRMSTDMHSLCLTKTVPSIIVSHLLIAMRVRSENGLPSTMTILLRSRNMRYRISLKYLEKSWFLENASVWKTLRDEICVCPFYSSIATWNPASMAFIYLFVFEKRECVSTIFSIRFNISGKDRLGFHVVFGKCRS